VRARHPDPASASLVTGGPRLAAAERLGIYRDGYRARLVECLADDYPAVQALLGADGFEELAHRYIERHPSRSPSLNAFGRGMAAFLLEEAPPWAPFAADLARLEWAIVEAIHAPASPALTLDRLGHLTPDQWPSARLVPAASAVVLRFAYPVNAYYAAFRSGPGEAPSIPDAVPTAVLVHRPRWAVLRTDLSDPMARLLHALAGGAPLGEALAAAVPASDEGAEAEVSRWFREWVEDGVFTAIDGS
jgi:hypothetical protein